MRHLPALGVVAGLSAFVLLVAPLHGQSVPATVLKITERSLSSSQSDAAALDDLRGWDQTVTELQRASRLRRRSMDADRAVTGRTIERFDQMHRGVRVFGGDLTRQTNAFGQANSVFGTIYEDINVDAVPGIAANRATALLGAAGNGVVGPSSEQELVVLPLDGGARLTWTARVYSSIDGHVQRVFVDAQSGATVFSYDDTWAQTIAARATGVAMAGDTVTIPVRISGSLLTGSVQTVDLERPGTNTTFDLEGDPVRATALLNGTNQFLETDIAGDRDNKQWNPFVLATHAYAALTYDYYLNTFGRQGLDDHNIRFRLIVNPARPETVSSLGSQYSLLFNNAAYYGSGVVAFGVGSANGGIVSTRNFGGAIDIVAHELTHGVTAYTSKLVYLNESGALNESFSDIMSVGVEFDNQPLGTGLAKSEWLQGEDVTVNGTGIRNFATPNVKGHPDHYSIRLITSGDNGGVHTNSSISNHAFYLAIMGGTNRVSGLSVEGVGFANRKQMEKVFYRAFTQILTANSTFSSARAACIQAARDLFGVGSPAERAVTQAWDAVGVV